jgi:uncharacterized membrane protein YfcA
MNNKSVRLALTLFVMSAVVRLIGIDKFPFSVVVFTLMVCMVISFASVLRYKGSKKERIYLVALMIIITLLMCTVVAASIMQNNSTQLFEQLKPILFSLIGVFYIALFLLALAKFINKRNENRGFKKK